MCSNIEFQSNVCDLTSENIEYQSKNLDFDQNKNYYPITPKSLKSSSSSSSRSSKSSTSSSPAPAFTSSSVREESQQKSFHVVGSDPQRESKIPQSQRHTTLPPYQHQEYPAINHPTPFFGLQNANRGNMSGLLSLEHYRLQLYNYAMVERLRNATAAAANSPYTNSPPNNAPAAPRQQTSMDGLCSTYPPVIPYGPRFALSMSLFHNSVFQPEEPKPQHSYIGLIAMAILSTPEHKLVLSDIYQHILDNYPYFRTRGPGWRNSIRHNLSLNDCFIKAGRSANGKGHYWAIHPANLEDFKKGDFRRRKAQRKVRKHMGLAVDDDGADSPSPPPLALTPPPIAVGPHIYHSLPHHQQLAMASSQWSTNVGPLNAVAMYSQSSRKRQFDVASLLAPDDETNFMKSQKRMSVVPDSSPSPSSFIHQAATPTNSPPNTAVMNAVNNGSDLDEDIDVVANDDLSSQGNDSVLDRNLNSVDVSANSSLGAQKGDNLCSEENTETGDEKLHHDQSQHQEKNVNESWNSLIQQFPMDPRILGRYYGQYMAAAQQRVASKRFINSINQHSPEEGQSSALPADSPTNKHCSE